MSKIEILELLKKLLETAFISKTNHDDPSGCFTQYYVDQDKLLHNIELELMDEIRS